MNKNLTESIRQSSKISNKGITLIALVITIIVLLILAGITISMLTGENGLLTKATLAKDSTRGGECQEVVNLAVSENQISNYSDSNVKTKDDVVQELYNDGKLTDDEVKILQTSDTVKIGSVTVDFSKLATEISKTPEDNENVGGGSSDDSTYIKKSSEKEDSYVGYYADIDDDGTVDGIIYADLAVGNTKSGTWGPRGDEWGNYSIPKEENINNLKDYTVSTHKFVQDATAGYYKTREFGGKEVIVQQKIQVEQRIDFM